MLNGTINIQPSIDTIASSAFCNCDNILSLSTNARHIGNRAFADCDRLVSVTLGDSTKAIGGGAFSGCFRLQSIGMGEAVESIGNGAFSGCVRLQDMQFGSGLRTLGDSAFYGCSLIHDIVLPEGLTTVGNYAFAGCSGVSGTVEFPSTTASIGSYAFNNSGTLSRLVMRGSVPPVITANTFATVSTTTPVAVPCGAVLDYYTTNHWENFSNLQEDAPHRLTALPENPVMGTAAVSQQPTCSNPAAIIAATAYSGYHFLRWSDGNPTNPRQVSVTQDTAFTAIFVVDNSYITVQTADASMGGATGGGLYGYMMTATLTATAAEGYHFLRWSDGNTQNPRYVQVSQDSVFTAVFASNSINISVVSAQPTMGTASGSGIYYWQGQVVAQATPNYGYHFTAWSDGNTQNPRNVIAVQDSVFTANFDLNFYAVNVSVNHQSMGSATGNGSYAYLHEMQMEASASYGYHFEQWNDGSTDNPRSVTVTRDTAFMAQFAANLYSVSATSSDPAQGSAYGGGTYAYGTTATLSATPAYGYHFSQWSDGVTDNPRTVGIGGNADYTAIFAVNTYDIAALSGNPAVGNASGGGTYAYLSTIYLTATPNTGYHFTQWSDGSTDNPRMVSVTQNATYTAQFAPNVYTIGVGVDEESHGAVSGGGNYNFGSTITITATAAYGYYFDHWDDGAASNPRDVQVNGATNYTAIFEPNSYSIVASSSNPAIGSVAGSGNFSYLSTVYLTATPNTGYHFTQWSDGTTDNPRMVSVTQNATYTAQFAINSYAVQVASGNSAMGSASGQGTYTHGSTATLAATAAYGYHFSQWSDGSSDNPRQLVVTDSVALTALFDYNLYTILTYSTDATTGSVSGGGQYAYLSQVALTAQPAAHHHFVRWADGSEENPRTLTLTRDTVLTAHFALDTHSLGLVTATPERGTLAGEGRYAYGSQVYVSATAAYGYHFSQWSDGNTQNPRRVVVGSDTLLTALFGVNQYTLGTAVNDATMGNATSGGTYDYLTALTLQATANYGYHFVQWSDGATDNPRLLTLTRDTSLTALFAVNQYYVSATADSGGSVSGGGWYSYLSSVTLHATAAEHHHFVRWSDGSTTNPRQLTLTRDTAFAALFEADARYTIAAVSSDETMGSVSGAGQYYAGSSVTLSATAAEHHRFRSWADGNTDNPRTVVVLGDAVFTALFEPEMHTVSVVASDLSMGQVAGSGSYAYGSTATIEARAFGGYAFVGWSDGNGEPRRTISVTADTTFTALFAANTGIDSPTAAAAAPTVSVQGRIINVVFPDSDYETATTLYDAIGRPLASRSGNRQQYTAPASGIYLLRTDGGYTVKVVVR